MTTKAVMKNEPSVYVYEVPVRLWHWINALSVVVLIVTGYFIGKPLPSLSGEAIDHYLMGYIRFAHFAAGYIIAVGFIFRLYWSFAGNHHARQLFLPPIFSLNFWAGVWHEAKWYLFLTKEPKKYIGHNPLAIVVMHFFFIYGMLFMIITGFAMYGEGTGMGSWQYDYFSSWVIPLFGQSQDVHTWHRLMMWGMICFIIAHIYVAFREDIMSRQSLVSTMISGYRTFKDNRSLDD